MKKSVNIKMLKEKRIVRNNVICKEASTCSENSVVLKTTQESSKTVMNHFKKFRFRERCISKNVIGRNSEVNMNSYRVSKESTKCSPIDKGKSKEIPLKKRVLYRCLACNKVFSLQAQYKEHYLEFHKQRSESTQTKDGNTEAYGCEGEFKCNECEIVELTKDDLDKHMKSHDKLKKTYMCDQCGKYFTKSSSFHYHVNYYHTGIKNFACDICERRFAQKHFVVEHRRIHTGERPYMCDSCGKAFATSGSLKIHSRTHTDYYPFQCTLCNHKFRTQQHYSHHLSIHTGEKKYQCDVCERSFRVPGSLKRHKYIHTDVFPFSCPICSLTFKMKRYLKNHIKSKHSDLPDALNSLCDSNYKRGLGQCASVNEDIAKTEHQ